MTISITDIRRRGLTRETITDLYANGELPGTPLADQLRGAADYEVERARRAFNRNSALFANERVPLWDPIATATANELVESARRDLDAAELAKYMLPNGDGGVSRAAGLGSL